MVSSACPPRFRRCGFNPEITVNLAIQGPGLSKGGNLDQFCSGTVLQFRFDRGQWPDYRMTQPRSPRRDAVGSWAVQHIDTAFLMEIPP